MKSRIERLLLTAGACALCACQGRVEGPGASLEEPPSTQPTLAPSESPTSEDERAVDASTRSGRSSGVSNDASTASAQSPKAMGPDPQPALPKPGPAAVSDDKLDRFGVRKLYATTASGREWYLPENAEVSSPEWNVEDNRVTRVSDGVFHTVGNNGEVRLSVASPFDRAWWRNVELTGYYRYTAAMDSNDQLRHWELLARGERHADGTVLSSMINASFIAPHGTSAWPGYPFPVSTLRAPCFASSYHGNFYVNGEGLFEKEISHTAGYAPQRAKTKAGDFRDPQLRWFGLKFVVRNAKEARVHLELWLDADATGQWKLLTETDDTPGAWRVAADTDLDGCAEAPFRYARDQLLTWAGPWLIFRSDSMALDFRWLSAREIDAL